MPGFESKASSIGSAVLGENHDHTKNQQQEDLTRCFEVFAFAINMYFINKVTMYNFTNREKTKVRNYHHNIQSGK